MWGEGIGLWGEVGLVVGRGRICGARWWGRVVWDRVVARDRIVAWEGVGEAP